MLKSGILTTVLLAGASALNAQLIAIKTVPLLATEQFAVTPTFSAGMAGLRLANEDSLRDPFLNPARGGLFNGRYLVSGTNLSRIATGVGGFFTIPVTFLYSNSRHFGGVHVSAQQMHARRYVPFPEQSAGTGNYLPAAWKEKKVFNGFFSGYWGRRLSSRDVLAGSLSYARLTGLSGQEYLFDAPIYMQNALEFESRLGWYRTLSSGAVEAVLVYQDFNMQTELGRSFPGEAGSAGTEQEITRTFGLYLAGRRQVRKKVRAGFSLTANRKWHPRIINYSLMRIPRDPGDTYAFEIGTGLMLTDSGGWSKSGVEVLFQPVWSRTWAEAEKDMVRDDGSLLRKGGRTIDNRFRIANWRFRIGLEDHNPPFTVQLGLEVRLYRYRLEQENHIAGTVRRRTETWQEWKPSFSLQYDFRGVRLGYVFGAVFGSGIPGLVNPGRSFVDSSDVGYLIAPASALTLQNTVVLVHRLQITRRLR